MNCRKCNSSSPIKKRNRIQLVLGQTGVYYFQSTLHSVRSDKERRDEIASRFNVKEHGVSKENDA